MHKTVKCPFCGEQKQRFEYVAQSGKLVRSYVCNNTGCFGDPFAASPRFVSNNLLAIALTASFCIFAAVVAVIIAEIIG